jgi:hypothetical protein
MKQFNFKQYIEDNTLRLETSSRGGGIEIDASEYLSLPGAKLTAYQNYLGGGMLGAICSDRNFSITSSKVREDKAKILQNELCKYFHELTNHSDDIWESASFEENQSRPVSAY